MSRFSIIMSYSLDFVTTVHFGYLASCNQSLMIVVDNHLNLGLQLMNSYSLCQQVTNCVFSGKMCFVIDNRHANHDGD